MGRQSRPKSKPMGAKLKLIRQHFGLSQTRMLAIVRPGLNPENRAVISQYEKGITDPDFPTLLNYARYARISTDVLIDDRRTLTAEMTRRPVPQRRPPKFVGDGKPRLLRKEIVETQTALPLAAPIAESINEPLETAPAASTATGEVAAENFRTESGKIEASKIETAQTAAAATESAAAESTAEEEMKNADTKNAGTENADAEITKIQSATTESAEIQSEKAATKIAAQTSMPAVTNADGQSGTELNGDGEARPEPFKRRLKDRLLEATDHDLEHFSTWLPSRLLDELDDLYLKYLGDAPRRARRLLDRQHFYHALFAALLIAVNEGSLQHLSPVWEEVVRQIEHRADSPPDLSSNDQLN